MEVANHQRGHDHLHYRYDHDGSIENVELVLDVILEPKANELYDHFQAEAVREDVIQSLLELEGALVLRVLVHRENNSVDDDQDRDY